MNPMWKYAPLCEAVEICDSLRRPINSKERADRIAGKKSLIYFLTTEQQVK